MHPKHWGTEEDSSEEATYIEVEIADSEVMAELKEWLDSQMVTCQDEAPHDPSLGE